MMSLRTRIVDEELLDLLQLNARMKFVDLADRLGVTETAVRKRMRKMVENGVIKKFTILRGE